MTLHEIVDVINELSVEYKIGKLQHIRKEIKDLQNLPCKTIFANASVFEKYAYHYGGRTELQFNIGCDHFEKFRFGVAFSLESSQSLPDVSILYPKIERYNQYFRKHRSKFGSYSGFTEKKQVVVAEYPAGIIPEDEYTNNQNSTFFFIGKYIDKKIGDITAKDCRTVLKTFDDLLDLYLYVESSNIHAK